MIVGLSKLITGAQRQLFDSGTYDVVLQDETNRYRYQLEFKNKKVTHEELERDGVNLFTRNNLGVGTIFAEKIDGQLEFSVPEDVLVVNTKRDTAQHKYLEKIHEWAEKVRFYAFGTSLDRDVLRPISDAVPTSSDAEEANQGKVFDVYSRGFDEFGEQFDASILADLRRLGYECTDVGLRPFALPNVMKGMPFAVLFVQEANLRGQTTQINMSQGMFRALGLVIHLNYALFKKRAGTILIDDIGEGLDFERSHAFVSLLIERAEPAGLQLVMTTNDRFVMNYVPLKDWGVIVRDGHQVHVINAENSPEIFSEFEDVGLNNFDFFATKFFDRVIE